MKTCEVWFELDSDEVGDTPIDETVETPTPAFTAADKIVGAVHVQVDKPCRDARLLLTRHWIASGRAPSYRAGADEILLFEGEWHQDGAHRFPFIFHVPPGPYTYHGRLVDLDWFLEARVEVGGVEVSRSRRKFIVEASGEETDFIPGEPASSGPGGSDGQAQSQRLLWWVGSLLLLFAGVLLLYPNVAATPGANWASLLSGVFCIGLAGYSGRSLLRRDRREPGKRWGFAPTNDDYEVEPGDSISFVVELQPNFKTPPRRVTALLSGIEQAYRKTSGPSQDAAEHDNPSSQNDDAAHIDLHRFYEKSVEIEPVEEGRSRRSKNTYRVRCRVPSDAPYSFCCPTASVSWAIEVHVDVGSWPNWRRDFPLIVRPNVNAATNSSQNRADSARAPGR
jgi:hypothetical protein